MFSLLFRALLLISICSWHPVIAQTTGNVYSSVINVGQQDLEYRTAFVPDEGSKSSRFAQRLHYQNAFREGLRWRTLVQGSDTHDGSMEFDFLQAELLWQFKNSARDGWDSALRFDARLSDHDKLADRIGLNWSGQVNFRRGWQARAVVLLSREVGSLARNGVVVDIRERLSYRLANGNTLAVEMFNTLGRSTGYGSFQSQKHRIGPAFSGRFGNGWSVNLGMLWALSDAASELDLRAALIKSF